MKSLFKLLGMAVILSLIFVSCKKEAEQADPQDEAILKAQGGCATIQSGDILYGSDHFYAGDPLETGFDGFGYNYQALKFQGSYFNSYAGGDGFPPYEGDDDAYLAANPDAGTHWAWPYRDVNLMMKWNTAWLSKKDCDEDGKLDRHYGYDSYIGSGAWLTNHQSGSYIDDEGNVCEWNYFVKIIAVPDDAYEDGGYWYNSGGTEIGPSIWGEFAIIQQVENDPCAGISGVQYISPDHAGLGGW